MMMINCESGYIEPLQINKPTPQSNLPHACSEGTKLHVERRCMLTRGSRSLAIMVKKNQNQSNKIKLDSVLNSLLFRGELDSAYHESLPRRKTFLKIVLGPESFVELAYSFK